MSKMFVHYSGTVKAFKSIASQYDDKIVFIKGGADGEGAAIYTHGKYYGDVKDVLASLQQTVGGLKYFTSIKAGDKTASATSKDGVITFNAADPAQVSVDVDAHGVNIGLSKTFTDAVAANTSGLAGEITRATEAESKIRTDLGQKGDAADAEGSAFARIAKLVADINVMTGGNGSIADQIDAAIKLLDVDAIEGDYVASISQVDGMIVPVMGNFNFDEAGAAATAKSEVIGASGDASSANTIYGAKKYADEKAAAAESAANSYADGLVAEGSALELRVAANEDAIEVLNGEGDGSVKKQVADAIAGVVAGADQDFDTLKEVADWIASDTTGAAKMQADIAKLQGGDTIEGSVAKQVKDAVAAEAEIARAAEKQNADDIDAAEGRIKAIEDDYLKATDKTTLQNSINTKVDQSAYDTKMAALAKADSDNLASAKEYTNNEIAKLDVTDKAVAGQYVSAVSETDGKISVTRADLPTYTLATGSTNGTVTFNGTNVAVKGLGSAAYTASTNYATAAQGTKADNAAPQATTYTKTEVDKMWEWEELN